MGSRSKEKSRLDDCLNSGYQPSPFRRSPLFTVVLVSTGAPSHPREPRPTGDKSIFRTPLRLPRQRAFMINAFMRQSTLACVVLAMFSHVANARVADFEPPDAPAALDPAIHTATTVVNAESLDVYDRPDEGSYITGVVKRGEQVKVRHVLAGGWIAIDRPRTSICWVENSTIEHTPASPGLNGHVSGSDMRSGYATITRDQAVMRSGNLGARLPGPPLGHLPRGTSVRLLDRPPLEIGRGSSRTVWCAIVPPSDVVGYVRRDGTRPSDEARAENFATKAVYQAERDAPPADDYPPLEGVSAEAATEIKSVDAAHRSVRTGQPIAHWRFESVRSSYEAILKKVGNDPRAEEAIRVRLARVTRDEQAARAAKTIEDILVQSHRRDQDVAAQKRRVAVAGRSHRRAFSAVGYMQASTESVEGRKLYVLIGKDGSTVAYLDIPPGLDIDRLVAHRVGVRGEPHFNEELGSRLITVRDLETMESRR